MTENAETITELVEHELPFGRRVRLLNIDFHNDLNMLRMIWREGKRITQVDIDPASAARLGADLLKWSQDNPADGES